MSIMSNLYNSIYAIIPVGKGIVNKVNEFCSKAVAAINVTEISVVNKATPETSAKITDDFDLPMVDLIKPATNLVSAVSSLTNLLNGTTSTLKSSADLSSAELTDAYQETQENHYAKMLQKQEEAALAKALEAIKEQEANDLAIVLKSQQEEVTSNISIFYTELMSDIDQRDLVMETAIYRAACEMYEYKPGNSLNGQRYAFYEQVCFKVAAALQISAVEVASYIGNHYISEEVYNSDDSIEAYNSDDSMSDDDQGDQVMETAIFEAACEMYSFTPGSSLNGQSFAFYEQVCFKVAAALQISAVEVASYIGNHYTLDEEYNSDDSMSGQDSAFYETVA